MCEAIQDTAGHSDRNCGPGVGRTGESVDHGARHELDHRIWSRRQFLGGLGLAAIGTAIPGAPGGLRAYARSALTDHLASADSDRVLVLIQLSGGNDGLNTVVPISNDIYYQERPTLAIPAEDALYIDSDTGLHPQLGRLYRLYRDGHLGIVHGVGYPNPALSHFTSTDVWVTGSDSDDIGSSGWLGRSLQREHPDFGEEPPDRPLAVQLGGGSPLLFQSGLGNMSMSLPNVALFDRLIDNGKLYDETFSPANEYGQEISFVRSVANSSYRYAESVRGADALGSNTSSYPAGSNPLARDLSIVARLIRGKLGSNIYHLSLGGFDTHANQANRHAALMDTLSHALGAFMNDLAEDGLNRRVTVATFSEFGRRIRQNASVGTDHGTAAPLFVCGGAVVGGIYGRMPSLSDVDETGNLKFSTDFRSVYATLLVDWLGVDESAIPEILGEPFDRLGFVDSAGSVATRPRPQRQHASVGSAFPNPFSGRTTIELALSRPERSDAMLFDAEGRLVRRVFSRMLSSGRHQVDVDGSGLAAGTYALRIRIGSFEETRSLVKFR